MAYNLELTDRMRTELLNKPGMIEKKMFGGIAFMMNGNMTCGVINDHLIIRVGKENYMDALAEEHTRPFDTTGRPMRGWIMVEPEGYTKTEDLRAWIDKSIVFTSTLPAK